MKLKKHPFILLELLIAIFLVSTTTLPFIHYPFNYLEKELSSLIRMELERVAEVEFVNIKGDLYQNLIPWNVLVQQTAAAPYIEKKVKIKLPNNIEKTYVERVFFSLSKRKKGNGEEELFLVHMKTTFEGYKQKLTINRDILIKQMPQNT